MNTTTRAIHDLMLRDLDKLIVEINRYENEQDLWKCSGDISNTAGNLCLHICGNLQHFIGATIGQDGYARKRDEEFNLKNVARSEMLNEIDKTRSAVSKALQSMPPELLEANYPLEPFGKPMTHAFFLIHLAGHLEYHLGQINYHRRLLI